MVGQVRNILLDNLWAGFGQDLGRIWVEFGQDWANSVWTFGYASGAVFRGKFLGQPLAFGGSLWGQTYFDYIFVLHIIILD